ncbi:hypothetical protein [Xanthobacter flavus]|uniref:hypothetical protein n=1 Tax=Xanthobacter flavus TaxID=281 RepID=UPI00372C48A3
MSWSPRSPHARHVRFPKSGTGCLGGLEMISPKPEVPQRHYAYRRAAAMGRF